MKVIEEQNLRWFLRCCFLGSLINFNHVVVFTDTTHGLNLIVLVSAITLFNLIKEPKNTTPNDLYLNFSSIENKHKIECE